MVCTELIANIPFISVDSCLAKRRPFWIQKKLTPVGFYVFCEFCGNYKQRNYKQRNYKQRNYKSSRRKTKQFSSYFRFPTSHTTVRAVPHTAVPILDTIRDTLPLK